MELLVGYQRMMPLQFNNDKTIINLQRILGQYLFNPPNVAGWPGGKNWIDSSSLVIRMRLPEALFMSKELNLNLKETDAEMMSERHNPVVIDTQTTKPFKVGKVDVDWSNYMAYWKKYKKDELPQALVNYLLTSPLSAGKLADLCSFADNDNDEEHIKSLTILLMELPEYQLT